MQPKNIHFIINPASGKEEPILSYINNAIKDTKIAWQVTVTTHEDDIYNTAKKLIGKTDIVVVYGGDGSITKVARALQGTPTPMGIIPGGTANVMSKELGIPQDAKEAIDLIVKGKFKVAEMDMGEANGDSFLLRINLGIMADMIINADPALKSKIGQVAYGITAAKTAAAAEQVSYNMTIDGKVITEEGVSLTVTNAGNMGFGNASLVEGISIFDGWLDVVLLTSADPLSLLQAAGTAFLNIDTDVVKHWRAKEVTIRLNKPTSYICDDCEEKAQKIEIKLLPKALKVLVPSEKNK
ncbi:hypothetical protein DYU05_02920 [Mucilaginibacter terrenus]|uniref:DAGKc domain-containing protein n=1 Tax=Mucilaginibacter terrenus TaxID=2482727 RepID=A0A3E2NU94_9SPHI|nr:diacylglycerol kinase family protein [Mucilaginibacter terrenus]RFZ84583.1 hypothetical protein DYU05_02920 [Mucilaginibacter terrenus]